MCLSVGGDLHFFCWAFWSRVRSRVCVCVCVCLRVCVWLCFCAFTFSFSLSAFFSLVGQRLWPLTSPPTATRATNYVQNNSRCMIDLSTPRHVPNLPWPLPTWNILYLSVCRLLLPNDIVLFPAFLFAFFLFCFLFFINKMQLLKKNVPVAVASDCSFILR